LGIAEPDVPTIRLNRQFIFFIRDIETETTLPVGQVVVPSGGKTGIVMARGITVERRRPTIKF